MSAKGNYLKRLWNWRRKAAGGLPSTETSAENTAASRQTRQQASRSSNTFHRSCATLTYDRFVEILLNGNLRWLIIAGHPTEAELAQAWAEIISEYSDTLKTDKSESVFALYKKLVRTQWQLSFVDKAVMALKIRYDEDIAIALNQLGYNLVEPKQSWDEYLKQLYGIQTEAKLLIVLLNQYQNEYNLLSGNSGQATARGMVDFERELSVLSRFQGYRIDKKGITVLEYCAIVNNYLEHCRHLQKAKHARDSV